MTIGMRCNSLWLIISWLMLTPSNIQSIITSRSTRSGLSWRILASPSSPFCALSTWYPCDSSMALVDLTKIGSSSITRILGPGSMSITLLLLPGTLQRGGSSLFTLAKVQANPRFAQGLLVKSNLKAGANVSTSVPATFARVWRLPAE